MEGKLKLGSIVVLILTGVSIGWMAYNIYAYRAIQQQSPLAELLGMYVAIGLLVAVVFHLTAFVTLFFTFQYVKKLTAFNLSALISGVISFITLIGEWAALHDIGDCLQTGMSCDPEWRLLYSAFLPHGIFYLVLVMLLLSIVRRVRQGAPTEDVTKDETVFEIVHIVGVCSGLIGLGFTLMMFLLRVKPHILQWIVIPYCAFILFPYGLIVLYWFVMKWWERRVEWYDEKQWLDIHKAGIVTVVVSIPLMTLMFVLNYVVPESPGTVMWFPFYLFLILSSFSGTTLYLSRS
jgi:heme/copper-type cytochrome/quinol oxidase subunit 2